MKGGERKRDEQERKRSRQIGKQTSSGQESREEPIKTHFKMRVLMRQATMKKWPHSRTEERRKKGKSRTGSREGGSGEIQQDSRTVGQDNSFRSSDGC